MFRFVGRSDFVQKIHRWSDSHALWRASSALHSLCISCVINVQIYLSSNIKTTVLTECLEMGANSLSLSWEAFSEFTMTIIFSCSHTDLIMEFCFSGAHLPTQPLSHKTYFNLLPPANEVGNVFTGVCLSTWGVSGPMSFQGVFISRGWVCLGVGTHSPRHGISGGMSRWGDYV